MSRHITKGNKTKKTGGFMGEAPPVGSSIVMSSPVMFSTAAAIPVNFQAASTDNSAAIAAAVAAVMKANSAAPAAAAATDNKCTDPCGDIKQLQKDVHDLKEIVANLVNVVDDMDKKAP